MESDNKNFSTSFILEKFKDENIINQIKNLEKQIIIFDSREKDKEIDKKDPQIIKGIEQIIFSIISNNIYDKINYFTDSKKNIFNFELFIYILMELIKSKISSIIDNNSKFFSSGFFKDINKNNIKKKQSIIINFLVSFYDDLNINESIEDQLILENESFLISCVKIIIILDKYIEKNKMKGIFGEIKTKENKKLINKLSQYLIHILFILIRIKKNEEVFKDNNNKNDKKNNDFLILIKTTYDLIMSNLIILLFDIIFNYDLITFFKLIINNDEISKLIINKLGYEQKARYRFLELLNNIPVCLGENEQKDLLKILGANNTIATLLNYISEDIKNKKYENDEDLSQLFNEIKILYFFSILINSKEDNIEKFIIKIIKKILSLMKGDKLKEIFESFIGEIFKMGKKIRKHKYKLYNFIFLLSESIPNYRKNILKIFFLNIKGNLNEYQKIKENITSFNLVINNIYNYEGDIIPIFFEFLQSLKEKDYFPINEINQILEEIPYFDNISSAKILILNLEKFTNINNININNFDSDNFSTLSENKSEKETKEINNNLNEFRKKIYESYLNVLYNIITELKENNISMKNKSPFDIDVTLSSIINTNYSYINDENNKKYLSFDILIIFIDFLSVILKEEKMLEFFISKKFLDLFPYLINDDQYKIIAYKLIKIFLESEPNNEKYKDKNKQQILYILNRLNSFSDIDEINKLKEILLMMNSIKIIFCKKSLISYNDILDKILNFYSYYPDYMNKNYKTCSSIYNENYHILIKKYLDAIFEIIIISNKNIILKNNNCLHIIYKNIKIIIENIIKFYVSLTEKDEIMNKYFLDIIKYFIDRALNIYSSSKESFSFNNEKTLNEKDFSLHYILKYKIDIKILKYNNEEKNKSIISNLCIQSPFIMILLLKLLYKYNRYVIQFLKFLYFLCQINQQNIIFLLKQNFLKISFKILKKNQNSEIILQLLKESFKYLDKKNFCYIFEQMISILNDSKEIKINKNIIKYLLQLIIKDLQIINYPNNGYCEGIILSENKVEQTNIYNMMEIKNIKLMTKNENDEINNFIIKQEIYFYNSIKTKKLLLLRISNNNNSELNNNNRSKNSYIEIYFRNEEINITENDGKMKYEDLSNYDSIFIDDNEELESKKEHHLKLNEKNILFYIFKNDKKVLVIYINDYKIFSYKYQFKFNEMINIEVGYPLDLIHEDKDNKFKLYNHINLKSFFIFSQNKNKIENIYKLSLENITCNYIFPDEIKNFKLDENTYLISKYNNINSIILNSILKSDYIKSQLYKNVFFNQILSTKSLNYLFRLEKYIFILLHNSNIDKTIFNELIQLLSTYLIMNKSFINKYFTKEEFCSSLYFSLYKNAKFIDKSTIENLLSIILVNNNNNLIIDILLDIKIFEFMNSETKINLINIINDNIIKKDKNIINIFHIFEKLQLLLILSLSNNKTIDELIINIIFNFFEENQKEKKILYLLEEMIYILFNFGKFNLAHISKFKKGKIEKTYKIMYEYFHKIYKNETLNHLKEFIFQKLEKIIINNEIKEKLNRLINSYSPSDTIESSKINKENVFNFKDTENEEDINSLFKLPENSSKKKRSSSFSNEKEKYYYINKKSEIFKGRAYNKKLTINNIDSNTKLEIKKCDKLLLNNYSVNINQIREPSMIPLNDVIIFKGIIKGNHRKSYRNYFKSKPSKKNIEIEINITDKDKEKCNGGDCHLCLFIKKILLSMFKREKNYEIYKNYILHCISEIFILNKNKSINLKYNFSYYLLKREGPERIRKRFNIRIDKLLNNEYDRQHIKLKDKKIENNNEYWKLFDFYENKEEEYINKNLVNFFNLGQIFNINIIKNLLDEEDEYQECFNCLLFKGLSYLNSVLILGLHKIYILSKVNISQDNILYDAHSQISKKFWILNHYEDILSEHCEYLSSYENNNHYNKRKKKKKFEKIEKGFWVYSFYYAEINEIHKRRYLHQNNAIEIFLKNGKNYYIAFNMNKRDKLIKLIISNIKLCHDSINKSFIINNKYNTTKEFQENENIKENNIIYEIQNENLIKNDDMIFIMNPNLFIENSKKYKRNDYLENIFKKQKQKKLKINLASIIDNKIILEKSYDKWTLGHISTYSYLMILNTLSGRTYNDLSQYPIYPWILSDFSSKELDFNNINIYRDFNYPIYAQSEESRENLELKYDNFDEISGFKYHSGSHYSNAGFVCYFLIRVKPFSISNAEIQGEYFDTTDRLFYNMEYLSQLQEKYQELIPDLFNIPEIYVNINKFDLGLNSEKKNIDNVIIPSWGKHSPILFCKILKKSIETQYVSTNINNWIDLIFGYKQKGIYAEKFYNVLRDVCIKFNPEKDCEDDKEMETKINEICEMGINPRQLFTKPHKKRDKHQKIKAFFSKNIFLQYFKPQDKIYKLKNIEKNDYIKEMRQYHEYPNKYISRGEGGLSSFRITFEEEDNEDNKNNNLIYFIISGKKTLIPPSYKNYIEWENNNCFYIIKYFKQVKYKFEIKHMKKYKINCIKITKDGNFIIIGYNNGIIEKYKLIRLYAPKINLEKDKTKDKEIKQNNADKEKLNTDVKKGLFNILFGNKNKNKRKLPNNEFYKNINRNNEESQEEDQNIINDIENAINKKNKSNSTSSNKILFDTKIPISTSNIINSDCIILNNTTGKFFQYSGYKLNDKEEINKLNNIGYDIYYHNNIKHDFNIKDNINNDLEKNYIVFLVNSSNHIYDEISMIEICEPFGFILIIDKENNLYILDLNTFDIVKKIDCNIYFRERIKFISICPITGDFILANNYQIILMTINGVLITKISKIKNKINYCFITMIGNSDLYLFTAHENGNMMISKLINNLNGIIFDENKFQNNLLNSNIIFELNNKYDPIKIKNISKAYYNAYNISNNKSSEVKEYEKYIEDENNFSLIFDILIEIKCSEFALKYIKLSQDSSQLICIDVKNNIINLNYDDFYLSKQKFKDKKSIIYCYKCKNPITSIKILCQICGKKLCSNCKSEIIIPEISLKQTKPVCDECLQLINKSNQSLYEF